MILRIFERLKDIFLPNKERPNYLSRSNAISDNLDKLPKSNKPKISRLVLLWFK